MYKLGLFIGRFQPVHEGHIHALKEAAKQVDVLHVLIGSANQCRSIKNPWTYVERVEQVQLALYGAGVSNVIFSPLNDYRYNDEQWISDVKLTAAAKKASKIILFGHEKEGNDYLKWFPEWEFRHINSPFIVSATSVREDMFKSRSPDMPSSVMDDWDYYANERKLFKNYPFPETLNFNCADAVVVCMGKVLLIQRKRAPGAGTWALPGGFRARGETFLDCAIRELQEETNIRVPEKVLRGSVVATELFDSAKRSFGIPRTTLGVLIRIQPDPDGKLPRANGADDASEAAWVDIREALNTYSLYDDHSDIIQVLTKTTAYPAVFNSKI